MENAGLDEQSYLGGALRSKDLQASVKDMPRGEEIVVSSGSGPLWHSRTRPKNPTELEAGRHLAEVWPLSWDETQTDGRRTL